MCCFYSRELFYIIVNSFLIGYLIVTNRINSCSRWAVSTELLLIPLISNLYYLGAVAVFFRGCRWIWCMDYE